MSSRFELVSQFAPKGDQPTAIESLVRGLAEGARHQVLLGITGSGKTFTVANVIQAVQKPTLILAPNKTLAAQLYGEMRDLFPKNAVEYFVSYYDYYQPEAYVPASDTYIDKDAIINDAIDRMRHSATRALLSRSDVIIVASVSCIYGIGTRRELPRPAHRPQSRRGVPPRQAAQDAGRHPVRAQRRRLPPRHLPRARRRGRGLPRLRAETLAIRVEFFGDVIEAIKRGRPLARQGRRGRSSATASTPDRTTSRRRSRCARPSRASARSFASGSTCSITRSNVPREADGSSSGPSTTSR